jgi:hypothetical protein
MFDEITASQPDARWTMHVQQAAANPPFPVNPAGFTIHSAIHQVREDATCVLHTHTRAGIAVSCAAGRRAADQPAKSTFVLSSLAYHEYEGVALARRRKAAPAGRPGPEQVPHAAQPRAADDRASTVADAFLSDVHLREHLPDPGRRAGRPRRTDAGEPADRERRGPAMRVQTGGLGGAFAWPALLRKLDRTDPGYKT